MSASGPLSAGVPGQGGEQPGAARAPEVAPRSDVVAGSAEDPLTDALLIARGAVEAGLGLKLLGGLAVRVLCPDYPPGFAATRTSISPACPKSAKRWRRT